MAENCSFNPWTDRLVIDKYTQHHGVVRLVQLRQTSKTQFEDPSERTAANT